MILQIICYIYKPKKIPEFKFKNVIVKKKMMIHSRKKPWQNTIWKLFKSLVQYVLWGIGLYITACSVFRSWQKYQQYDTVVNERDFDYYESKGIHLKFTFCRFFKNASVKKYFKLLNSAQYFGKISRAHSVCEFRTLNVESKNKLW